MAHASALLPHTGSMAYARNAPQVNTMIQPQNPALHAYPTALTALMLWLATSAYLLTSTTQPQKFANLQTVPLMKTSRTANVTVSMVLTEFRAHAELASLTNFMTLLQWGAINVPRIVRDVWIRWCAGSVNLISGWLTMSAGSICMIRKWVPHNLVNPWL